MSSLAASFQGVHYKYPDAQQHSLAGVTLELPEGAFVLVVGPSGSGKSTLLRVLNGLVPNFYGGVFGGVARVCGRDPVALGPRGMSDVVGFVFQDPEAQFVVDSVEDELAFGMEMRAWPQALMATRVQEVSELLGITELLGRRVSSLSGGQRQRVAIAAALALRPKVLVLDEPTSQLDPAAADELFDALLALNKEHGLTVILSEHRLERVAQYADIVWAVRGPGQPVEAGEPRAVFRTSPLAPPVAMLGRALGWEPVPLTVEEARAQARPELLEAKKDGRRPPAPGPVRLAALGISYSYGERKALRDVSVELHAGEIVAVQGHNGAGKTTLLKCMLGLLRPQAGHVLLDGKKVHDLPLPEVIRKVGYVPQNPNSILFQETVLAELQFTRRSHGLKEIDYTAFLSRFGLAGYAESYPRDLSQGERQRVALAAILVAEPEVLLLDEPTLGLDYAQKKELIGFLRELRAQGVAILMATHDVELVASCADRTIILSQGQVVDEGPPGAVMLRHERYASQIARLFGDGLRLTVEDVLESTGRC
jgi:energy-coupling factor transport system ATP-binding protein